MHNTLCSGTVISLTEYELLWEFPVDWPNNNKVVRLAGEEYVFVIEASEPDAFGFHAVRVVSRFGIGFLFIKKFCIIAP